MKSRESGYFPFVAALFFDACDKCHASMVDVKRDLKTIESRLEHEGMSFLTITLPDYGAAFDRALSDGQVDLTNFSGWRSWRRLPAFLRGFVCQVFDVNTGVLLDEPSTVCVEAVRQICLCFKKVGLPCSKERERKALDGYVKVEHELHSLVLDQDFFQLFGKVSDLLWPKCFGDFNHHDLVPKHGPGAVVEKLTSNHKFANRRWHSRLEPFFPPDSYVFANPEHWLEERETLELVPEGQEEPVKVTLVPKTLKAPRIIAIEPCCMQYTQQGLKGYLVSRLESHWLTRGHVNFSDQTINQRLAITASRTCDFATLDMSDASDRVSLAVVRRMLLCCPDLMDCLDACRSKAARLPSGVTIPLSKFASMGSAVCFPIEAMVFYTIAVASVLWHTSGAKSASETPVSFESILDASRGIYVYGDDIIVPTGQAEAVADSLRSLGNKVNARKSFYKGNFRESCGVDAFRGEMVTPTYVRAVWPRNRNNATELVSLTATANQFYLKGYYRSFLWIRESVERVVGALPPVEPTCSGLGWYHPFSVPQSMWRFNRRYQVLQVHTWVPGPSYRSDTLDGWPALLKYFIMRQNNIDDPSLPLRAARDAITGQFRFSKPEGFDEKHLERSSRHGAAGIKRRVVTPF